MWGPTFPELVEALPGVPIIDRSSVNAFDDPKVAQAITATGRKKLIFAGISLEVCAAFPDEPPDRVGRREGTQQRARAQGSRASPAARLAAMTRSTRPCRRFPPPWTVEETGYLSCATNFCKAAAPQTHGRGSCHLAAKNFQ
jgi:Isochorismatase family